MGNLLKGEAAMKRIKEKLEIRVEYLPNDYLEDGDDWELYISVNEDNAGPHNITPFGKSLKGLTVNELVQYIKEAIEEELFE